MKEMENYDASINWCGRNTAVFSQSIDRKKGETFRAATCLFGGT